jgi:hypothetical protein
VNTKLIKRQMYGRAGFTLLRHRILLALRHAPSPPKMSQSRSLHSPVLTVYVAYLHHLRGQQPVALGLWGRRGPRSPNKSHVSERGEYTKTRVELRYPLAR